MRTSTFSTCEKIQTKMSHWFEVYFNKNIFDFWGLLGAADSADYPLQLCPNASPTTIP